MKFKNIFGWVSAFAVSGGIAFGAIISDDILQVGRPGSSANKDLRLGTAVVRNNVSGGAVQYSADGINFRNMGSGSGGVNYLSANPDAESGITGWSVYDDSKTFVPANVNTSTGVLTVTGWSAPDNTPVTFITGTTLPAGLSTNTTYYTTATSGGTFKVAATIGGAAIVPTTQGTGTHTVMPLVPMTGVGGSPAITFASSATSPMRGTKSFVFTHDATNRAGQGAAYAFTTDRNDNGKPMQITFDYEIPSGTYVSSGAGNSMTSDLQVYIYDVTNAKLVPVSGTAIPNISSTTEGTYNGVFATNSNSNSYRLLIHASSFNASAFTVKMDDFYVGPQNTYQISQAQLMGTVTITGCAANWSSSGTSYADFSAQTGCVYTTTGNALAPATMIPAIKFASLPPGNYTLEYEGGIGSSTTSQNAMFQFWDGVNTALEQSYFFGGAGGGVAQVGSLRQSITYTTPQSNVTLSIRGKVASGGSGAIFGTTGTPGTIRVYYYPTQTQTAFNVSSTPASWSGSFNSLSSGWTVSTNDSSWHDFSAGVGMTLNQIQARNISGVVQAAGSLPGITFTPPRAGNYMVCANGAANASTAGNGYSLRIYDSTNGTQVNNMGWVEPVNNYGVAFSMCGIDNIPSVAPTTIKLQGSSSSGNINLTGYQISNVQNWSIVELDAPMSAPYIIPNSALSNNISPLQARIIQARTSQCTASPCTILWQSGSTSDGVSSITRAATGNYTINFAPGTFVSGAHVTCSFITQQGNGFYADSFGTDVSYGPVHTLGFGTGTAGDSSMDFTCVGQR